MNKQSQNRVKWLHIRMTKTEHDRVREQLAKTTCRALSEFARVKILDKPVTVNYRNASFERLADEMILLRSELSAIGRNFNQVVRKLHLMNGAVEFEIWTQTNERHKQQFFCKMEDISAKLNQIISQWSQKS